MLQMSMGLGLAEKGRWGTISIVMRGGFASWFGVGTREGLTIRDRLSTPKPAVWKFAIVLNVALWTTSGISCFGATSVYRRQERARTLSSFRPVSGSENIVY